MNTYIIVGEKKIREIHIENFLKEKKISSYNIIRITETVKIALARELKRRLSFASGGVNRAVILPQDITQDAQNALLKTIEEIDESTYILIESESRDSLLPTIVSRCTIVALDVVAMQPATDSHFLLEMLLEENKPVRIGRFLSYIDSLGTITEEQIKNLILEMRGLLIQNVIDIKTTRGIMDILKRLTSLYTLCQNNNVNKKMMLETVFLQTKLEAITIPSLEPRV